MKITFGEGCDGDAQANLLSGMRGHIVGLVLDLGEVRDDPFPMGDYRIEQVCNARGGLLQIWAVDENGQPLLHKGPFWVSIEDEIIEMEVY